jgi:hypothetical protein
MVQLFTGIFIQISRSYVFKHASTSLSFNRPIDPSKLPLRCSRICHKLLEKFLTFPIPSGVVTAVRLLRSPNRSVKASRFAVQSRGATAVKWLRPLNGTVKFLTFLNQPGGATAVRLAAPSKQNRKGFELNDSISRRSRG